MNYVIDHGIKPVLRLQSEGYVNDTIMFDKNGLHYIFLYNKEKDPNYFELILPYIDDFHHENTMQFETIKSLTKDYKAGKVIITPEDRIALTFEQYVFSNENINKLFEQAIGCLEAMITEYRQSANNTHE